MYFCKRCGRRFKERYRTCPNCGGPCRKYQYHLELKLAIFAAAIVLIALLGFVFFSDVLKPSQDQPSTPPTNISTPSTAPTDEPTDPPTEPPTDAPTEAPTDAPTEPPTEAPTQAPATPLYTRDELENMSTSYDGYGPGPNRDYLNNRPEYAVDNQNAYGKYGGNFIAPDNGNIYLTFDCGYEHYVTRDGKKVQVTSLILDTLKEKNVKAVFFVTMHFVKSEPDLVKRMISEGHTVGNHTANHPSKLHTLTIDKITDEVMTLHDYVHEHFGYTMNLFRPPEGAFSIQSLALLQNLGYKTVHWSFAHNDWDPKNQPDVQESLTKVLDKSHSGAIYLLHAVSETNATLLGDAIDGFLAKGFNLELFS